MKIINFNSTDVGLVRKSNEDCMGQSLTPNGHLYVVCDGMGGHLGGATASKIGVDCVIEYVNKKQVEDVGEMLVDAVKFANTQVFAGSVYDPQLKGMGSTCVLLLITTDGFAWTCHVGDSRIYLFRKGKLTRLTKDHSYVQFLVDTGEITEAEAEKHPNKNQILRALGSDEIIKPELGVVPFKPENNDIFLLCSDGLTGMVAEENIAQILKNTALSEASAKLVEAALANGGKDNVTVSVVQVQDVPKGNDNTLKNAGSNGGRSLQSILSKRKRLAIATLLSIIIVSGLVFRFVFYKPKTTNGNGSESAPRQNDSLEYKTKAKEADSLKMIKDNKTTPISTPSVKSNKDDTKGKTKSTKPVVTKPENPKKAEKANDPVPIDLKEPADTSKKPHL